MLVDNRDRSRRRRTSLRVVIIDAVGSEISKAAFRSLGWRGRHPVIGFAANAIPSLPLNIALLKGASLVGIDSVQIQRHESDI